MEIRPLTPSVGAEVLGADLARDIDAAAFARIEQAYKDHSVLLFRDQHVDPSAHVRFSRRFGELEIHVLREFVRADAPEVYILSNIIENGKPIGIKDAGNYWHTDLSYTLKPSRGSLLYALEVPHDDAGAPLGDTQFVSTVAAYDSFPAATQRRIEGLSATHRFWDRYLSERKKAGQDVVVSDERRRATPDVVHPMVRVHPYTGKKYLYVNEGFTIGIVGLSDNESRFLLDELYAHIARPQAIFRHRWRVGDLVMWDNYATQHRATVDFAWPKRRLMHRTTLCGVTLQ